MTSPEPSTATTAIDGRPWRRPSATSPTPSSPGSAHARRTHDSSSVRRRTAAAWRRPDWAERTTSPSIGRDLLPDIDIFWTGPEIISRDITVPHVRELRGVIRRKPLIWDNLHANDYDGRRFFCGPYAGRPQELRSEVRGLLSNPNCELPLNFVPLRTLAGFVRCAEEWNAREAYLSAMREWLPSFATVGRAIALEDLILFGDCYYLPHEEGPEAADLYETARGLLDRRSAQWDGDAAGFREPGETAARLLRQRDGAARSAALPRAEPPRVGTARGARSPRSIRGPEVGRG